MIVAAHNGDVIEAGIDHRAYTVEDFTIADKIPESLVKHLNKIAIN
jgi:hypothetical protein